MTNVFDTTKIYSTILWGHSFTYFPGSAGNSPELPGTFAADTVEADGKEFAVFTVSESETNEYPAEWAGTFRIDMVFLAANPPAEIGTVPEPDPDPDDPSDPDTPGGDDPDNPETPANPDNPETPGEDGSETDPENNSGE